jgi:hypothetical protein
MKRKRRLDLLGCPYPCPHSHKKTHASTALVYTITFVGDYWPLRVSPQSQPYPVRRSKQIMLLTVRRSALAAVTTGRYAVRPRPATLTTPRWLTSPSRPVRYPPSTVVTPIKKNAPSGEVTTGELRWNRVILPALEAFARVYGHCRVLQHFVVPSTSAWPPDAWGVKLGSAVNSMRTRRSFTSQTQRDADRLLAINFVWDAAEYRWTEQILPALTAFATKFGHCDVPQSFVVPLDPAWPRKAWKLNLGSCVNNMRVHGFFCQQTERDAAQLEAIGFVWVSLEHR